ncbi:MAG: 30S ribosomal protein S16 [Acidimicrobiales bacterium]
MSVKLRLMRMGKKKQPTYRVVVADSRSPRDGRFIEAVGTYAPRLEPSTVEIDNARALEWLAKGAQPTETVRKLLVISGAWEQFEATRTPKPVSERYARPGRSTTPAKKAPAKKAPAKKAPAKKAPAKKAAGTKVAPTPVAEAPEAAPGAETESES